MDVEFVIGGIEGDCFGLVRQALGSVRNLIRTPFYDELGALDDSVGQILPLVELAAKLKRQNQAGICLPTERFFRLAIDEPIFENFFLLITMPIGEEPDEQIVVSIA